MNGILNFLAIQLSKPRWLRGLVNSPSSLAYVKYKGLKFFFHSGDSKGPSNQLLLGGVENYDPQNQKYLSQVLNNGDVFLDVGAHIGVYSLLASVEGPQTRVYAFDPEQNSRECIQAGIEANDLKNIKLYSADLSRLTSLDFFVEEEKLSRVDLIRVDVKDLEFEIFNGARRTIEKFRPIIFAECEGRKCDPAKNDLFGFFQNAGYAVFDPKYEKIYSIKDARDLWNKKDPASDVLQSAFIFPQEKTSFFSQIRKHLIFLAEHLSFGGSERALIEYLSCIDRSKYKLSLILRDDRPDNYLLGSVPDYIEVKTIYPRHESLGWWRRLRKAKLTKLDLTLRMKKAFQAFPSDSYICDFCSVLIKQAHYFSEYKKIFWIHGPKSQMDKMELRKFGLRLRAYDLIIAVSEHLKEEMQTLLPSVRDKVVQLYNPFDIDRIKESADDESDLSAEDRNLLKGEYILAVGRFVAEKDFITLIRAYRILRDQGFSKKLYIVGDGHMRKEIEEEITRANLWSDVVLLGARPNPYVWMKNAQLFVHSAFTEGFGLVLVEAMALSRAVVVTDSPVGPREVLENGHYGVLVPVKDPHMLAEGIKKIFNDVSLHQKYEVLSLNRAKDFGADQILDQFDRIITSL